MQAGWRWIGMLLRTIPIRNGVEFSLAGSNLRVPMDRTYGHVGIRSQYDAVLGQSVARTVDSDIRQSRGFVCNLPGKQIVAIALVSWKISVPDFSGALIQGSIQAEPDSLGTNRENLTNLPERHGEPAFASADLR